MSRALRAWSAAVLLLSATPVLAQDPAPLPPLTFDQLLTLAKNHVAPARIAGFLRQRCTDFDLTAEQRAELARAEVEPATLDEWAILVVDCRAAAKAAAAPVPKDSVLVDADAAAGQSLPALALLPATTDGCTLDTLGEEQTLRAATAGACLAPLDVPLPARARVDVMLRPVAIPDSTFDWLFRLDLVGDDAAAGLSVVCDVELSQCAIARRDASGWRIESWVEVPTLPVRIGEPIALRIRRTDGVVRATVMDTEVGRIDVGEALGTLRVALAANAGTTVALRALRITDVRVGEP